MTLKRAVIAFFLIVGIGWAAWIALSFGRLGDSLPVPISSERPAGVGSVETVLMPAGSSEDQALPVEEPIDELPAVATGDSRRSAVTMSTEESTGLVFASPASVEERCRYVRVFGVYAGEPTWEYDIPANLPIEDMRRIADDFDYGYAQYRYADHLRRNGTFRDVYVERVQTGTLHELPDEPSFLIMRSYYIDAMRNHTRVGATELASIYRRIDKVEAIAWLVIDEMMGGPSLSRAEASGLWSGTPFVYTESEKLSSEARAEELIAEFELDPGLSTPEECL